ncbi:MAG TPA: DNA methyltransferase [Terriglobia bacterium]|nr:DNA methyltransferase [Terriglobia bacterium]
MPVNVAKLRERLQQFEFQRLFIEELGWDHHAASVQALAEGQAYNLTAFAEKRGFQVFTCIPAAGRPIPDYATRRKIETQLTKSAHEHLIIYTDSGRSTQVWQWVKRETGKPTACREHTYHRGQPGDALIQKLQNLLVAFEEEEVLTLVDVTMRTRAGFDVEKVTKRFYDRFKEEHSGFLKFLKGIPEDEMQRWYVSVMLNRLMFIYFIQKKGFLNSDTNYLRTKLAQSKQRGRDRFYADFLCPLFFEGFAKKESARSSAANHLLGKVPYLNGGLFLRHQIEELHDKQIQIGDGAFEKLFEFFDQYRWHLDERPLRKDDEINPDVLGYIFEKYINQKQMGAYYTKEDITGYISQNTVIPFLFDAARQKCKIAFEGDHTFWRLLEADPDRYIYPAVKHGIVAAVYDRRSDETALSDPHSNSAVIDRDTDSAVTDRRYKGLPPEIAAGLNDVSKRTQWNKPAPAEYALPTEIWREVVARRNRYQEVRAKLAAGEVRSINDLITYNLDIRQFAQDVIENCEGPELLRAFYHAIEQVTVLDPACGSGAFLFAALNILEPLYEACLDRMEAFLEDLERESVGAGLVPAQEGRPQGSPLHTKKYSDFRKILDRGAQHPNRRYFILKSIIVNNLYGVDIMEEATEICKLRLFLKLVAQIDTPDKIEPLPDIDFNIRAGNTLVGYATYDDVKRAVTSKFDFEGTMQKIEEKAREIERLFVLFRQQQTEFGGTVTASDKQELRKRLKVLEDELNRHLAGEYGIKPSDKTAHERWLGSHKPFHWFIEFHGIMKGGGFDAIIGNPPFVELAKVQNDYKIRDYKTEKCGNLYPLFLERAIMLAGISCRSGFIIPMAGVASRRTQELRNLLTQSAAALHVSSYAGDTHPSILFEGVRLRLSIVIWAHSKTPQPSILYTTVFQRWYSAERSQLFPRITMSATAAMPLWHIFPRLGGELAHSIWLTLLGIGATERITAYLGTGASVFYQEAAQYFVKASHRLPYFSKNGNIGAPPHGRFLTCAEAQAPALMALLTSTLFYVWYHAVSDCYHLSDAVVQAFPCPRSVLSDLRLRDVGARLERDLHEQAKIVEISTGTGDKIAYAAFNYQLSKRLIDEIDRVLAKHYGFTDEELDFIINYDIKYRMGRDAEL